jgi:catechol 2,3-dioxygenase-like lactoylglutathione lyase family enzyme
VAFDQLVNYAEEKGAMAVRVGTVALVVDEYDRAIGYYRDVLGLELVADTPLGGGKRWVIVAGAGGARILLAKAEGQAQAGAIGNQAGGRVGFFLETDDFAHDHARLTRAGVRFLEAPRHETYGSVAVFEDLYGNKWDLIEPKT